MGKQKIITFNIYGKHCLKLVNHLSCFFVNFTKVNSIINKFSCKKSGKSRLIYFLRDDMVTVCGTGIVSVTAMMVFLVNV